jgi:lipopolysaccharide export system protein LptA
MHHKTINLIFIVLLTIFSRQCFAEQADHAQPIKLQSNQVIINDRQKISIFTGAVQLTQGTLKILGEKVVVSQDKQGFKRISISGERASFRQKREETNEYVEGFGERIEYNTNTEQLDLYTHARIKRNQDEIRGKHITYNIKTGIFQAKDNPEKTANAAPQRVQVVLYPKSEKESINAPNKHSASKPIQNNHE